MEIPRRRGEHNLAATDSANHLAAAVTGLLAWLWDPALEFTSVGRQSPCPAGLHAYTV
jgi:hypothetical protein